MDILYKWEITGIDGTLKTQEGLENVARVIHWICRGCLEDYDSICNNRQGFVILDNPGENFLDYADVTEEIAFSWLFSKLDRAAVEDSIAASLVDADKLLAVESKTPLGMSWVLSPNVE